MRECREITMREKTPLTLRHSIDVMREREREREGGVGMKRRDARSLAPPPPSLSFILVDGMRRNLSPSLYNV